MGTRFKGTPDEVRALDTYIKLMRAADAVAARVTPSFAAAGLTMSQFGVLEAIYHLGPLCQRDLGQKILRSSGNVTQLIDNLEKRGLVRRERGAEDRRYIAVHLTESGTDLLESVLPTHVAAIAETFGVLDAGEQTELGRLCRAVGLGAPGRKEQS
jgi:MarR family 2-MHQ and catechol resistance regulon transcriptional repressor